MKRYAVVITAVLAQVVLIKNSYACKSDSDCKGDRVCDAERCVAPRPTAPPPCHQDTDCKGNDVCEQSVCVAPATPSPPAAAQPPGTALAFAVATPADASPPPSAAVAAPTPVAAPSAPAMPPPQETAPVAPNTGPAAPVAPGAPVAAAGQPAATAQSGGPIVLPGPTSFKSATLLVPDMDNFYGVSITFEEFIKSMRGPMMAPTLGVVYDTLVYTGGGDAKAYMQALGMTVGIRPSMPIPVSFALRAGAIVTLSHFELGSQSSNDFDVAFVASGDLMFGYLTIGAQGWIRDNSIWMLRAGFAW